MKKLLFVLTCLLISACATNPNKVEQLKNVEIEKKGSLSDSSVIGINKDSEAVVQSIESVEKELTGVVWWNNNKELDLNHEYAELLRCKRELRDPRLGGLDTPKTPELRKKWEPKSSERVGLVGQDLVVVKEQYLKEKMSIEKERSDYYDEMIPVVKQSKEDCEDVLSAARVKAGLPGKRYQGAISITPDGKVGQVFERHENSLDDAFEIKEEKALSKVERSEDRAHKKELQLEKARNPRPVVQNPSWGIWGQ